MTGMTFRKGIAALCFLSGIVLFLIGAYYIWVSPIEQRMVAVIAILVGFLLHTIFWILWPRASSDRDSK